MPVDQTRLPDGPGADPGATVDGLPPPVISEGGRFRTILTFASAASVSFPVDGRGYPVPDVSDYGTRFSGIARLFGQQALPRLRQAHVMVVGVGGVGSWTVEALARTGVGALTLVDLDELCFSNVNRQLPALDGTIGLPKVEVLRERVGRIHPECRVTATQEFFTADTAENLLETFQATGGSHVVDAIDSTTNKCLLIRACGARGLPLVLSGAAGGRADPTQVRVSDLARVTHDRLLSEVRKRLRRESGYPRDDAPWGLPAVHSVEPPVLPQPDGTVCEAARAVSSAGESPRLNCQEGYGSAAFVTGTFGLALAAEVTRRIVSAAGRP